MNMGLLCRDANVTFRRFSLWLKERESCEMIAIGQRLVVAG